ncbi:MAG: BcsR/BcsP family cellulose biosynthesis protein [Legionellales bacterium]
MAFIKSVSSKIPKLQPPEDLVALSKAYSLGKLNYIAITQQEQFKNMLDNWPLFAELAKTTQGK